jgi:hypothetical protein
MRTPYRIAAGLVLVLPVLCWATRPRLVPDPRVLPDSAVDPTVTYSNILPDDYVGPGACVQCHAGKYRLWSQHPHRKMNQLPGPESVQGKFDGSILELTNGKIAFTTEGDSYRMTVTRQGEVLRRYRVTRTVGSRYIQFYIGVQTEGPEPAGHDVWAEHLLPFAWWRTLGRWLPKHYCDLNGPEDLVDGVPQEQGVDKLTDVRPWTTQCVCCHNTLPYAYRAVHKLFAGFPDASVCLTVGPLASALSPHIDVQGNLQSFELITRNIDPEKHLVTLGVSCESCHFGGREHALAGGKTSFLPTSPYLKIANHRSDRPLSDSRKNPATVTGICTQCHAANVALFPGGQAQCNSREAIDFIGGACASQMTCIQCHEPHTAGPPEDAPTNPAHLAACVGCHGQYADADKAAAHSGHPAATKVDCLDCHMPKQTLGLDVIVRTHRISTPVSHDMAAKGLTNACNLCHLDKSLNWTLRALEFGWGRKITPRQDWESVPDLDRPMGEVWLQGPDIATRCIASQSYARSPLGNASLPDLIRALNDPEPVNRVFHSRAVQSLWGREFDRSEYEVTAPPATRLRQIDALIQQWKTAAHKGR